MYIPRQIDIAVPEMVVYHRRQLSSFRANLPLWRSQQYILGSGGFPRRIIPPDCPDLFFAAKFSRPFIEQRCPFPRLHAKASFDDAIITSCASANGVRLVSAIRSLWPISTQNSFFVRARVQEINLWREGPSLFDSVLPKGGKEPLPVLPDPYIVLHHPGPPHGQDHVSHISSIPFRTRSCYRV